MLLHRAPAAHVPPLLSIVVATYNRAACLERLLAALHASPARDCDIWVLDNASPDGTAETCRRWQARWPSLRCVTHPHNIGAAANFLKAYEYGNSVYQWLLCDDDELRADGVAELLTRLEQGDCDLVRVVHADRRIGTPDTLGGLLEDRSARGFFSIGFVPGIVFRRDTVLAHVADGYAHISTFFPHVFVLMRSFGVDSRLYTLQRPAIVPGTEPTGIGCEMYLHWLSALPALPTEAARRAALAGIFERRTRLARSLIDDIRLRRPRAQVMTVWMGVLRAVPWRWKGLVLLNGGALCVPFHALRWLSHLRGRPIPTASFDDIVAARRVG